METRAAAKRKKESGVVVEKQHPKKRRVVLGELSNLPNLIVPKTQDLSKQKRQCLKSSNIKKLSSLNNTLSSLQIDQQYASHIDEYLRAMEVILTFQGCCSLEII